MHLQFFLNVYYFRSCSVFPLTNKSNMKIMIKIKNFGIKFQLYFNFIYNIYYTSMKWEFFFLKNTLNSERCRKVLYSKYASSLVIHFPIFRSIFEYHTSKIFPCCCKLFVGHFFTSSYERKRCSSSP